MTPLTSDEIAKRLQEDGYLWVASGDLGTVLDALRTCGLAVVDATDTPNDDDPVLTEIEGIVMMADREHYRRQNDDWWLNRLDALLKSRTSADVGSSTGGSSGGRGTVTQKTSAHLCQWCGTSGDECERFSGRCMACCDACRDNVQIAHSGVTQETSADDLVAWLDQRAHYHQWHGNGDIAERYTLAADLIRVHSQAAVLPFPNAYPGPRVDGQPTWGAYLRDVPDEGYEMRGHTITQRWWPTGESRWDLDAWVQVRRIPQPEHTFSDDEPTYCYTHERHCGDPLRSALERIDIHGCETFTGSRCLDLGSGRSRDAEYGAERWCDACIARDALNAVELVENEATGT